jgi:hypothetical protein
MNVSRDWRRHAALLRKAQHGISGGGDDAPPQFESGADPKSPDPVDEVVELEGAEQVREQVGELIQHQCEALTLRFFDGLSNAEIAVRLNTTPHAVACVINRALRAIKGRLPTRNDECREIGQQLGRPDARSNRESTVERARQTCAAVARKDRATSSPRKAAAMAKASDNPKASQLPTPEHVFTFIQEFRGSFSEFEKRFSENFGCTFDFFFARPEFGGASH